MGKSTIVARSFGLEERLRNARKREWCEWILRKVFRWRYDIQVSGLEIISQVSSRDIPSRDVLSSLSPDVSPQSPNHSFVIAPNHVRFVDGFLMGLLVPSLDFALAKEECWLNPVFRFFAPDFGGIPVVRRERLPEMRRRYGNEVVDYYIDPQDRFRMERYIPHSCRDELVGDIGETVGVCADLSRQEQRRILSISDLDGLAVAQYIVLKGRNLLVFPQGTRRPDHNLEGGQSGLYNILSDLLIHHGLEVPVVPCRIQYGGTSAFRPCVKVALGEPLTVRPYLQRSDEQPDQLLHRRFIERIMESIGKL